MKILLINGAQPRPNSARGEINAAITKMFKEKLQTDHMIMETIIDKGYDLAEEREKLFAADLIILQFPIYWFSMPAGTKVYFDDVFHPKTMIGEGKSYGYSGNLKGKYILSATWYADEATFNNSDAFLEGASVDDVLFPIHKALQFIGLEKLGTFSIHDVINNPNIPKYQNEFTNFIQNLKL